MKQVSFGILIGLVVGVLAVYSSLDGADDSPIGELGDVRVFETVEVEQHRNNKFEDLNSIKAIQALPGEFTRAEALYALCSRSTGEELVNLALDATRITDPFWREPALAIIFERLAETDPNGALKLARSEAFRSDRTNQATVLQTWARFDLAGALAAVSVMNDRYRSLYAQMIYSGVGGAYTAEAQMVEDALGVKPAKNNREKYVRGLAEFSPEAALDHVLSVDSKTHQREEAQLLARLYAYKDVARAEQLADKIADADLRRAYLAKVYDELERSQPQQAALKRLSIRGGGAMSKEEKEAFALIAKDDLNRALAIYEAERDEMNYDDLGDVIAREYVKKDPRRALEWARSTKEIVRDSITQTVIVEAAGVDPVFALQEAGKLEDNSGRSSVTRRVMSKLIAESPQFAAESIVHIEHEGARISAARQVSQTWFEEEPFVAFDWVMSEDDRVKSVIFKDGRMLKDVDVYEAQALVAAMPAEHRKVWARHVAGRLIDEESPESAVQFVSQFAGQPDHDMQMAFVIARVGEDDGALAMQWIDRLDSGHARDGALSTILVRESKEDPATAVSWLELIDDPDLRQTSAGNVVTRWLRSDPDAARRWLDSMPRGAERDNILVNATMDMYAMGDLQDELIQSVDDPHKRDQAMLIQGLMNSRNDPEELISRLEQMEIPEIFKQQLKSELLRGSLRGY